MQENTEALGHQEMKRDSFLDLAKGLLILFVLLGHAIQYGSGGGYLSSLAYYDCWLFKLIYGFHMPAFMMISGFLFYRSVLSKSKKEIVLGKLRTIIVPIFSFAFIVWMLQFHSEYSFFNQIRNYLSCTRFTLWFLWALFYCSIGVLLVHWFLHDHLAFYILLVLLSYLTTDKWYSELYKFMFPCFLFGYFARKNNWMEFMKKNVKVVALVTSVVYAVAMFVYYDTDTYVYMSGSCILKNGTVNWYQLFLNIYRTLVGICGSVAFLSVLFLIRRWLAKLDFLERWLALLGTMTMGIYCFQNYFWILYSSYITWMLEPVFLNQLLVFLASLLVSLLMTMVVKRIRVLNVLFLGGR